MTRSSMIAVLSLFFATLVLACILIFPTYIVNIDSEGRALGPLKQAELLKAKNDIRTTLLQGIGGLLLVFGAIATWRQIKLTQEGQITERFSRAIDQLGHAEVSVRMGGIYALERIARDSRVDETTIAEVLSSYVRSHSRLPKVQSESARKPLDPEVQPIGPPEGPSSWGKREKPRKPGADIQAAILALGRTLRNVPVDLTGSNLAGINFRALSLQDANFINADLRNETLFKADLQRAAFLGCDLRQVNANGADLREAKLAGANLEKAVFFGADLRQAFFYGSNMRGAVLGIPTSAKPGIDAQPAKMSGANLTAANLEGSNLRGVDLRNTIIGPDAHPSAWIRGVLGAVPSFAWVLNRQASFKGAVANKNTKWPEELDPTTAGAIVEDAN
jgi:uncharacterized protein YjbI with pentapeptide repeats